jgi:Fur family ferric uptake transcriptional regulator
MQKEKERLRTHLEQHHLKQTRQREVILEIFLKTRGHVTAEELHQRVQKKDPSVGLATVYRTLNLFCQAKLAEPRQFGDGHARYEVVAEYQHHDHLICTGCGKIIEFSNCNIEQLQEQVAQENSFTIYTHKLEIYGLCIDCRGEHP